MNPLRLIKLALAGSGVALGLFLLASSSFSKAPEPEDQKNAPAAAATGDYVGSDTCKACHEAQFNSFAETAHAKLSHTGWKTERQGCESCHGPGKAHVDAGGDKTKIRTFEHETAKQKSEACLSCHAGKEEHNNFRRGEHWRNDVGCTDCHSPHYSPTTPDKVAGPVATRNDAPSSLQALGRFGAHANDLAPAKMLVKNDPQLCLSCHNEMKGQFTRPFHHRVLEGAMKCSDCHNPHGGFELKQARLAVGSDAACVKCHSDKQGPFVFEHAPLKVEGCSSCHDTHGSANPKMLKRNQMNQLCIECHTNTLAIGAPNTPSFHNQSSTRFQNCTTCHAKIHGSNVNEFFFR